MIMVVNNNEPLSSSSDFTEVFTEAKLNILNRTLLDI